MMALQETRFHSPYEGSISFEEMLGKIIAFVEHEPKKRYKIVVGSDSASENPVPIVTAVLVWRIGNGGTYFLHKSKPEVYHTRRDRIIAETMSSIMLAQELRTHLSKRLGDNFLWDGNEIHADVGEKGETRKYIKEVTGLIAGVDFVPVIKPYSWCASSVADRHT